MSDDLHRRYLAAAIRLGAGQLGRTWPNPAVGCLIVRDGVIVGQGATGQGGRPHGETRALADAGVHAHGATAYVSLEPCDHQGKTGPCTQALIEAGIAEVFIALGDPDPRVSGAGVKRLQAAGLHVRSEPFADLRTMAVAAHAGHISRTRLARPHVTLKLALSADGAIGVPGQGQVAITGTATNRLMHGVRSRMDAIAVGGGTLRADAPKLTVRLPGLEVYAPKRFAFTTGHAPDGFQALEGRDLKSDLEVLGTQGITRLLIEGGAKLAQNFLREGLVDELILLKGTSTLGSDAIFPFAAHPFDDLAVAGFVHWRIVERRKIGDDQMMVLRPEH